MNNQLFKEISKLTIYNDEQINEMIQKYKDGDESQLNKIIESNLKLITFFVKQFEKHIKYSEVLDIEDLISEGVFAIKQAALNFKPELNIKFSYYSSIWIKNQISEFIINNRNTIRVPVKTVKSSFKIEKDLQSLFQQTQNEISQIQIEDLNKYSKTEIDSYFNKVELIEVKHCSNSISDDVDDLDSNQEMKAMVKKVLKYLSPKERTIIKMLYGIEQDSKSQTEIAKHFKITKARVNQYKISSLKKLRAFIGTANTN